MTKVLYVTCSSFSGSTLLSFLLNTNSKIVTVGHTTGWNFSPDEDFRCSCGEPLDKCPFFASIAEAFRKADLPFAYNRFGTAYSVVANERTNRYLTAGLPVLQYNRVERLRDALVHLVPRFSAALDRQDRANRTFIQAALAYGGAEVYLDNSHGPHRLRHLSRISGFDLYPVHLVRDFRGVTLSHMKRRDWTAEVGIRYWLGQQASIARVLEEFEPRTTLFYEDVCDDTNAAVGRIHNYAGLAAEPVPDDFKTVEHHILGNVMRQRDSKIARDTRWMTELDAGQRKVIEDQARAFIRTGQGRRLTSIVEYYLDRESL